MASAKSHKGMSNAEWLARLESFAQTGVWPSTQGNRPSPRQKRWHEMYQKVSYAARFMGKLTNFFDNTLWYFYLCVWLSNYM